MAHGNITAFAPGRVTVLGDGTRALAFALDRGVTVRATTLPGPMVMARARDLRESDTFDLHHPDPAAGWRGFVRGTTAELAWAGNPLRAARLEIFGTLPRGVGLSSSSARSAALALAMLAMAGIDEPDRRELARLCTRVERDWTGARGAVVDSLVALLAEDGCALQLDLDTQVVEQVPLPLDGWTLAMVATGERRARPEPLDGGEGERVLAAVGALRTADIAALGPLLDASHAALGPLGEAVARTVDRCRASGAAGVRLSAGGAVLALFPPGVRPPAGSQELRPCGGARTTS
jgi:galactokinase